MKLRKIIVLCILLAVATVHLSSETEKDKSNWGFIFNTSSILLDIESYQAGLGAKILLNNDVALRFLLDGFYSSSTQTFSTDFGITFEKHLRRRRTSPYLGGFASIGIMNQIDEIDEENWTKNRSVPIGGGAVLGIEFFILESISLFAEYNVAFAVSILSSSRSDMGTVREFDREISYEIDAGIGNGSKLGIIIYLDDVISIKK